MTDGWGGPRPIQVPIATALLFAAGVIQLLVAVYVVAALGAIALALALPIGALGFCAAMFGYRILDGRNRQAALVVAFLTMLTAPFTIPSDLLALADAPVRPAGGLHPDPDQGLVRRCCAEPGDAESRRRSRPADGGGPAPS